MWTPGYWAFVGGAYLFHQGYWGQHVGFYGGVNYGYGYNGLGYEGGRWEGNRFVYNTTVNNFGGVHVTNVYTQTVAVAPGAARASYNGGPGGIALKPTPEQERLTTEEHVRPTPLQVTQARTASMERDAVPLRQPGQARGRRDRASRRTQGAGRRAGEGRGFGRASPDGTGAERRREARRTGVKPPAGDANAERRAAGRR